MIAQMISYVFIWINSIPVGSGISDTLYPHTIMTGTTMDFNRHCQLKFGAYADIHEHPKPLNSQKTWCKPFICLGLTGNIQGSYWFLKLHTDRRIKLQKWKTLPALPTSSTVSTRLLIPKSRTWILTYMISLVTLLKTLNVTIFPTMQMPPKL